MTKMEPTTKMRRKAINNSISHGSHHNPIPQSHCDIALLTKQKKTYMGMAMYLLEPQPMVASGGPTHHCAMPQGCIKGTK